MFEYIAFGLLLLFTLFAAEETSFEYLNESVLKCKNPRRFNTRTLCMFMKFKQHTLSDSFYAYLYCICIRYILHALCRAFSCIALTDLWTDTISRFVRIFPNAFSCPVFRKYGIGAVICAGSRSRHREGRAGCRDEQREGEKEKGADEKWEKDKEIMSGKEQRKREGEQSENPRGATAREKRPCKWKIIWANKDGRKIVRKTDTFLLDRSDKWANKSKTYS